MQVRLANLTAYDVVGKQIAKELGEERVRSIVFRVLEENVLCAMATVTREGHVTASVLLERIKAEREKNAESAVKKKPMRRKKAAVGH